MGTRTSVRGRFWLGGVQCHELTKHTLRQRGARPMPISDGDLRSAISIKACAATATCLKDLYPQLRGKTRSMPRTKTAIMLSAAFSMLLAAALLNANAEDGADGNDAARGTGPRLSQTQSDTHDKKANKPTVALPNGASSINETYGEWSVACSIIDNVKACTFSQAQGNTQTGQRTFAIELRAPQEGKTDGVLLMPFGLKLDDGVKMKIDEQGLGQGARFSTCIPQGCLVPISFPTVATDALRKGTDLIITASNLNGGEAPTIKVSLNGFTAAMNRVVDLSK